MFHSSTTRTRLVAVAVAGFAALFAADQCSFAQATQADQATAKPAGDLPKAEKLFEKARDAMGGRKAFDEVKSMHVIATIEMPEAQRSQMPGDVTLEYSKGENGKFKFEQKMGGMGAMMSGGSNGEVSWANSPFGGGYQILTGQMKDRFMDQTMLVRHDMLEQMKEDATGIETVGSEDFADEDAWKVRMKDEDGNNVFAFFSKDSGRLLGVKSSGQGQMGRPVDMTMKLSEWKEFGPLTLYTKMVLSQGGQEMTINFDTIELNKVDPAVFELPDEVKEMAEKNAESDTDAGAEDDSDMSDDG